MHEKTKNKKKTEVIIQLIQLGLSQNRRRRNHFILHSPLYRHHSLQSRRQSCCHKTDSYMLANISVHLQHTGIKVLCTLYCIYMQSAPSRLAGQANTASSQLLAVHLLSSIHVPLGLVCLFLTPNIFFHIHA